MKKAAVPKWVVVDCNYLCHRAFWTTGYLQYNNQPTGVIFGFLNQIYTIARTLRPTDMIFTWDSPSHLSKRRQIFPAYKTNRKKEDGVDLAEMYSQFHLLQEDILPRLGFINNFSQQGYEADDIIAVICQNLPEPTIIASSDDDLLQLLSPKTSIYNLGRKRLYAINDFYNDYGIKPYEWHKVKQIAGCSGDGVPGVIGVGEKTAVKYLTNSLNKKSKKYQDIKRNQKIIDRNEVLVKLPFPGTEMPNIKKSEFNDAELEMICQQYGFTSWLDNPNVLHDWKIYFNNG